MRKIIQSIKSIKIKQVLTVFMAGCLLLITTACSKGDVAQGERGVQPTTKSSMSKSGMSDTNDTYNKYDASQEYKGGMNGYNDDRRYDSDAGAAAKAKTLVDTAKRRQVDNVGDYVDNVSDRAQSTLKKAQREVPRNLKNNQETAVDYVQDKSENLKRNLSKVPGGVKDVVDEATSPIKDTVNDANEVTKKAAQEVKGNFKNLS
jgi:gas vesicle protein